MTFPQGLAAAWALAWREIIRFFRQKNRIIGSIGTPLVFWLLFGVGLSGSFRVRTGLASDPEAEQTFLTYFFPGSLLLMVLFTAIFSSISIIEDRREGFLQGVLVSPVPRWAMILGKVAGGGLVAFAQGLIFLALGLTLPIEPHALSLAALVLFLLVASLAVTALGTFFAWRTDSTQGFHAIMNLVLMPLWLLSGGFFPAPAWGAANSASQLALGLAMRLNPLSYAVGGVRRLLVPSVEYPDAWVPTLTTSWLVTLLFAGLSFALAVWVSRERTAGDLQ